MNGSVSMNGSTLLSGSINVNNEGVIEPLSVDITENGDRTITAHAGVDGYNPINIHTAVPQSTPVLDDITITENGTYTPPSGTDGYNDITVNVPQSEPVLDDITITENGTYTPPTGTDGYDEITVNVPLPENAYLLEEYENVPTDIASFTASDAPLKSLTASIEPQQDLHGYDYPWVGGAGKNKIPPLGNASNNGITMTTDINGNTIFNGTVKSGVTFDAYVDLPSALTGNYVLSINNSQTIAGTYQNTYIALFNGSTRTHAVLLNEQNTKIVVTNGTITRFFIRFQNGVTVTNFKISVQLEEGSTATSYLPYSNICPISGWTDCEVTVADDTTTPTVEQTTTIPFTDSQGQSVEVFGGTLDVTTGVLTVDKKFIDVSSLASSVGYNSGVGAGTLPNTGLKSNITSETLNEYMSNCLKPHINSGIASMNYEFTVDANSGILFKIPNCTSVNDYQTWVTNNNLQIVGELATPITIQLTPTAVKSLDGENNVSASTGDVDELKYFTRATS